MMSKAAEEGLRVLARHCFSLLDVAEDVAAALDHKNPKGELPAAGCAPCALRLQPRSLPGSPLGSD